MPGEKLFSQFDSFSCCHGYRHLQSSDCQRWSRERANWKVLYPCHFPLLPTGLRVLFSLLNLQRLFTETFRGRSKQVIKKNKTFRIRNDSTSGQLSSASKWNRNHSRLHRLSLRLDRNTCCAVCVLGISPWTASKFHPGGLGRGKAAACFFFSIARFSPEHKLFIPGFCCRWRRWMCKHVGEAGPRAPLWRQSAIGKSHVFVQTLRHHVPASIQYTWDVSPFFFLHRRMSCTTLYFKMLVIIHHCVGNV